MKAISLLSHGVSGIQYVVKTTGQVVNSPTVEWAHQAMKKVGYWNSFLFCMCFYKGCLGNTAAATGYGSVLVTSYFWSKSANMRGKISELKEKYYDQAKKIWNDEGEYKKFYSQYALRIIGGIVLVGSAFAYVKISSLAGGNAAAKAIGTVASTVIAILGINYINDKDLIPFHIGTYTNMIATIVGISSTFLLNNCGFWTPVFTGFGTKCWLEMGHLYRNRDKKAAPSVLPQVKLKSVPAKGSGAKVSVIQQADGNDLSENQLSLLEFQIKTQRLRNKILEMENDGVDEEVIDEKREALEILEIRIKNLEKKIAKP
jgi:hypothetical protein